MKWVKRIALLLVVALAGLAALQYAASETTGEVIVVTTTDSEGNAHETRLWVVDSGGDVWLRSGQEQAGWYSRIQQNPAISVTRDGETNNFTAIPVPAATDTINHLMREKYTWGDKLVAKLFGRKSSVAIRLEPRR